MNREMSGAWEHIGTRRKTPKGPKTEVQEEEIYEPEEPPAACESCAKPTAGGLVARKTLYTFFCFSLKQRDKCGKVPEMQLIGRKKNAQGMCHQ
jgi:hypothetical protein